MVQKLKLNEDMIYRKIGEQRMLVPIGRHIDDVRSIYTLNETAAFVLDAIKSELSIDDIVTNFTEEYDCAADVNPQQVVSEVIDEFKRHEIIL